MKRVPLIISGLVLLSLACSVSSVLGSTPPTPTPACGDTICTVPTVAP